MSGLDHHLIRGRGHSQHFIVVRFAQASVPLALAVSSVCATVNLRPSFAELWKDGMARLETRTKAEHSMPHGSEP